MGDRLTLEQEIELGRRCQQGDVEARSVLCEANLDVIHANLKHFTGRGVSIEDLKQEGFLGLMRAAGDYDPERGVRFSTHAVHWVRECLKVAVFKNGSTIRVPEHVHKKNHKLKRFRIQFFAEHNRQPTRREVREALGFKRATLEQIEFCNQAMSAGYFEDSFEPPDEYDEDDTPPHTEIAVTIREALRKIPREERDVLERLYGLHHQGYPETTKELCRRYGMNKEQLGWLRDAAQAQLVLHLPQLQPEPQEQSK